jgi:replicative DNA helicase Mcm
MSAGESEHEHTQFFKRYYGDEVAELAQRYPNDQKHLRVDWSDLVTYDRDVAMDFLEHPGEIKPILQNALADVPLPIENNLGDVDIRMVGLDDSDVYSPLQVTRDADDRDEEYIGVRGELSKVTEPKKEITKAAFQCARCSFVTEVPQARSSFQEPHECAGCERQGPFDVNFDQSTFTDHVKIRVETPPDETGKLREQSIDGEVRGDLVWSGGEDFGIPARTGDRVIVYGTVEKEQIKQGNSKTRHFEEYIDVQAIEFDDDADDVKIEKHRDEFEQLAERDDAVDVFADSIAPQLYATNEWEFALEALVAYLFGSPRVNIPEGPTIRGDIHVLIVSDYGMGKSMVNEAIADFSPQVIKESVTGMSSDVGLLAAAVEDDFGEGQWALEPGILVRANGGHVILDEIDKTDADLERMNDALEGEQVVDVNKAGQSATFKSRVGLLATGNPKESRFDDSLPISDQLGIDQSLLSRFDAIVTMEDRPSRDKDQKVAQAQGMSYVEAQEYAHGDRDQFDHLSRDVTPQVGRAWVAHAREEVNPQLRREHVEQIRDWYADEVRTLNEEFADGDGGDMPVPVSARSVMDTIRFAVAFARVHLRDEVTDADVERAMSLTRTLVGQTFENGKFGDERGGGTGEQDDWKDGVYSAIDELAGEHPAKEDDVYTEAQERDVPIGKVEWALTTLKDKGEVYEPEDGAYRVT